MEYMNKILVGFTNGREIKFETDYEVNELYLIADNQGFIDQIDLIFNLADVSYMMKVTESDKKDKE